MLHVRGEMVDFLSLLSLRFWEFESRGGSPPSRDYRLRYTVVPSTECSRLCFWRCLVMWRVSRIGVSGWHVFSPFVKCNTRFLWRVSCRFVWLCSFGPEIVCVFVFGLARWFRLLGVGPRCMVFWRSGLARLI